jgi:hypothetical protein
LVANCSQLKALIARILAHGYDLLVFVDFDAVSNATIHTIRSIIEAV